MTTMPGAARGRICFSTGNAGADEGTIAIARATARANHLIIYE
jgi:hypothetical protein